ncbi:tyrosine-type recombinase/integrase [Endozoicomonas sp. ONNA2]|uniref:tyrosine-type recombinase/integrase n=1 Tax=Endozoicomonas sp. ONNA2 TaxID=2828741 RepID=UPI00214884B4|nr:tyrosine-type recombinase/integrase [Endozoicomonas sp. ONNA2]
MTYSPFELLLNKARKLRYYTILLTLYSMGLRLAEGLNLTISDIDARRMKVHLRNSKGERIATLTFPFPEGFAPLPGYP